jgi:hypothetical protein
MRKTMTLFCCISLLSFLSCNKGQDFSQTLTKQTAVTAKVIVNTISPFLENMETGTKTAYATANVTLTTGVWNFNDALLGNSSSDVKDSTQSARVRNSGILAMQFDKTNGAGTVTVYSAKYGSDASTQWQLWYSTNSGSTFVQSGSTITTSTTKLVASTFTLNVAGNVRIEIKKTDGSTNRTNFDDISITDYSGGTNNPVPALLNISPATATAGASAFTLTANGSNFISSSVIQWKGTNLTTTYVSPTQLTATVPGTDIATTGSAAVTVFNPTPGGGTSAADTFKITTGGTNNPVPTLTTISPASATAGAASFTLTTTGTNYITASSVQWNGASLATTYVSATKLTATVPATDVATAGSATVTVFNPAPGGGTSTSATFTINPATTGVKKFLFDASHAETAGNADWVIDEDNSKPQRIPTPAQSTITSSTKETYWTGAISSWGIALVKQGEYVETLPSGVAITYGNTTNVQDLSNYNVFVVDEPNTVFTTAEKTAILQYIQSGGSLLMISDHTGSDRNNDGWDSPAIWNDLMTNNTIQNDPFGFSVDLTNISGVSTNVLTSGSSNPILNGTQGKVTSVSYDNGATLTLHPTDNATVQGLIWESGDTQNNSNVLCASSTFGAGRVFVITDSSPEDDGTGASGNTLYSSWTSYSHTQLLMNASMWLARLQ